VTAPRRLDGLTGPRLGDHACWTFADAADFSAAVLPVHGDGRGRGEQVLLIGSSGREPLDRSDLQVRDVAGPRAPAQATHVLHAATVPLRRARTPRMAGRCLGPFGPGGGGTVPA
jgi:hypothetical protein